MSYVKSFQKENICARHNLSSVKSKKNEFNHKYFLGYYYKNVGDFTRKDLEIKYGITHNALDWILRNKTYFDPDYIFIKFGHASKKSAVAKNTAKY